MLLVILDLLRPPALCLVNSAPHGVGNLVSIHNNLAIDITGGTTGSLRQRAVIAQEALLVGIENSHKAYLRQVKTLTQQVHAHNDVIIPFAQVIENLNSFKCIDSAVDISAVYTPFMKWAFSSSAMRLVKVVTKVRSPASVRC